MFGELYRQRPTAYPEPGVYRTILPRSIREIADEIIREVFITVKGEEVFIKLSGEPGLSIRSTYPEDINPSGWAVMEG